MIRRGKTSASRLQHKLALQEEIRTGDEIGGYIRSWKTIAEVWAEILPLSGREYGFAGGVQAEVSHRLLLRWRERIRPDMRFVFDGRVFNIRAVMNIDERSENMEVLVQELA